MNIDDSQPEMKNKNKMEDLTEHEMNLFQRITLVKF